MSFRPTIAVYYQGRIADIRCFRNADGLSLLSKAASLARLYGDCRDKTSYMRRRYGRETVFLRLDPVLLGHTSENLRFLESCSEFPVIVDCTARCIYVSFRALDEDEIRSRPVLGGPEYPLERLKPGTDFLDLMSRCVIPFSVLATGSRED